MKMGHKNKNIKQENNKIKCAICCEQAYQTKDNKIDKKVRRIEDNYAKKLMIPIILENALKPSLMLFDSGSDVSIITKNTADKMVPNWKQLPEAQGANHIESYTANKIPVEAVKQMDIAFIHQPTEKIKAKMYIVSDNNHTNIFGKELMLRCQASLRFQKENINVQINKPKRARGWTKLELCEDINEDTAIATISLQPKTADFFTFTQKFNNPRETGQTFAITSNKSRVVNTNLIIIPTRSQCEITPKNRYTQALVYNTTTQIINKRKLKANIEILQNEHIEKITKGNKNKIEQKYKIMQQILQIDQLPTIKINQIDLSKPRKDILDTNKNVEKLEWTEEDLDKMMEPQGYALPENLNLKPTDIIKLKDIDEQIRPFIEDIFITSYPDTISTHRHDCGNLSATLGQIYLRLKPNHTLPKSRRIFRVTGNDKTHLDDILAFLEKFNIIQQVPNSSPLHEDKHYGAPCYVIPRQKKSIARLIIDYKQGGLNESLQTPPSILPDLEESLDALGKYNIFSQLDLVQAYNSLEIAPESQHLTRFCTQERSYNFTRLPFGISSAPVLYYSRIHTALHSLPVPLLKNGKQIIENGNIKYEYESPHVIKMIKAPMENVQAYFDDIACASNEQKTTKDSLEQHFKVLKEAVKRLSFHGAKISYEKSKFYQKKILWVGWNLEAGKITPDKARVQKILDLPYPQTLKQMRTWLGTLNSIKRITPLNTIKQLAQLTPLTSTKGSFKMNDLQKRAFDDIKIKLTEAPLFCYTINPLALHYLFVDSSLEGFGAVLLEANENDVDKDFFPTGLNKEDKLHQLIAQHNIDVIPLDNTIKDNGDAFYECILAILNHMKCSTPPTVEDLREKMIKHMKNSTIGRQMKQFRFNNNHIKWLDFLQNHSQKLTYVDKDLMTVLAETIARHIIIIRDDGTDKDSLIQNFNRNQGASKPPLYIGMNVNKQKYTPFVKRKLGYLEHTNIGKNLRICYYLSNVFPKNMRKRHILDLEAVGLLSALHRLRKYITGECHLLTDSATLYFLFSKAVHESSTKCFRYAMKLISDYPQVKIHFVRTFENLADFLTRQHVPATEITKFRIHDTKVENFTTPKELYTWNEWRRFVNQHPEYLKVTNQKINAIKYAINNQNQRVNTLKNISHLYKALTPIDILRQKITREKIIQEQKIEFKQIIDDCINNKEFKTQIGEKHYMLREGLLMMRRHKDDEEKIVIPKSMVGPILAVHHLMGHRGPAKLTKDIQTTYYIHNLTLQCKKMTQNCFQCWCNSRDSTKRPLGEVLLKQTGVFKTVFMDLCEDLVPHPGNFRHILVIKCVESGYLLLYPLRNKTTNEVLHYLSFFVTSHYVPTKLITDNGPSLRSKEFLGFWAALGCQVVPTSRLNPKSRGYVEVSIRLVKNLMKKLIQLYAEKHYDWQHCPLIIALTHNFLVSPRTGFSPAMLVHGISQEETKLFTSPHILPKLHPRMMNYEDRVKIMKTDINLLRRIAIENINHCNKKIAKYYNKHTHKKDFKRGTIVFILDKTATPTGQPVRPLRPIYTGPYIVIRDFPATTLIQRIADNSQIICAKGDIKELNSDMKTEFTNIPEEVLQILNSPYQTWRQQALDTIAHWDNMKVPDIMPDTTDIQTDNETKTYTPGESQQILKTFGPEGSSTLTNDQHTENNFQNDNNKDTFVLQDKTVQQQKQDQSDSESESEQLTSESGEDDQENDIVNNEQWNNHNIEQNLEDDEQTFNDNIDEEPLDIDTPAFAQMKNRPLRKARPKTVMFK